METTKYQEYDDQPCLGKPGYIYSPGKFIEKKITINFFLALPAPKPRQTQGKIESERLELDSPQKESQPNPSPKGKKKQSQNYLTYFQGPRLRRRLV